MGDSRLLEQLSVCNVIPFLPPVVLLAIAIMVWFGMANGDYHRCVGLIAHIKPGWLQAISRRYAASW